MEGNLQGNRLKICFVKCQNITLAYLNKNQIILYYLIIYADCLNQQKQHLSLNDLENAACKISLKIFAAKSYVRQLLRHHMQNVRRRKTFISFFWQYNWSGALKSWQRVHKSNSPPAYIHYN